MWECPDLVEAVTVPGLGNELGVHQHGVLADLLNQRRLRQGGAGWHTGAVGHHALVDDQGAALATVAGKGGHHLPLLVHLSCPLPRGVGAREDGGQVKAEAINVVLRHPEAQAVHNEAPHHRVVAVEGVAAAAVVVVLPLRRQHVVHPVVQPPEGDGGAHLVALRGVVEHHVQDDLHAAAVGLLHKLLELCRDLSAASSGGRRSAVAAHGGEEAAGGVAPEVETERSPRGDLVVLKFIEILDGEQLHCSDAKRGNIVQLLGEGFVSAGV
mmetsp:Transcript_30026/g.84734  ORF Transcript_30026/g.84734 Transcript_30026/m.84734 type:complete len:269 (+) Transcript_30026:1814-2620(+)